MNGFIDLHTHTTASDGSMTPSELVKHAAASGFAAVAVTDHDTVEGVEEALAQGKKCGIEVVPGIEISVDYEKEMHILGYYINHKATGLSNALTRLKKFRDMRNPRIVEKLNQMGFDISMDEIVGQANGGIVGRPHIANAMVKKGYVKDTSEAFLLYLGNGKPAYISKERLPVKEGIGVIKEAGGIAVLAHPIYLNKKDAEFEVLLTWLIQQGLDGMECYYTDYSPEIQQKYLELAHKYQLVVTGGSDFHGTNKPDIQLGIGYGSLQVPYELLQNMK